MSTFNNKPQYKNVIAVILGLVGIVILLISWCYQIIVQYVTMPRNEWLNPVDRKTWLIKHDYPNVFCFYFCNIEATLINQIHILRVGYGVEYCKEDLEK